MWHHPQLARTHEMLFEDHLRAVAVKTMTEAARSQICRTMRAWFDDGRAARCAARRRGHLERADEIEDHLSVGSAEDAELVLEQDRSEAIGDDAASLYEATSSASDDCHDVRPEVLRVCHDCRDTGTFEASSAREGATTSAVNVAMPQTRGG
jgi:hypothetical protein